MDRRTALATAGAIVVVTITGAAAIGANLGVLDRPQVDPVGRLQPNDPEFVTVVVEPAPLPPARPTTAAGPQRDDDWDDHDDWDDDHDDWDDDHDERKGRDDEDDEHEGRDDDD
jgi:hypothetical protein